MTSFGASMSARKRLSIRNHVDEIEAPAGMSPISSEAIDLAISKLPSEFHNASCVAQWSSSAGRAGQKIKIHLWFWLSQQATDEQKRHWALSTSGLVDFQVYKASQPIYTARPVFENPTDDPFAEQSRVTFIRKAQDTVDDLKLERPAYGSPNTPRDDAEVVRDDSGKVTDGRNVYLRGIRWSVLHNRRPKGPDEFKAMVWERVQAEVVL